MDERDERVVVTPAAPGSETEPVTVSSGQALVGVFTRPRPTFEGMRAKPHYRLALAILLVFQLLFTIAIFESGAILNDTVAKLDPKKPVALLIRDENGTRFVTFRPEGE